MSNYEQRRYSIVNRDLIHHSMFAHSFSCLKFEHEILYCNFFKDLENTQRHFFSEIKHMKSIFEDIRSKSPFEVHHRTFLPLFQLSCLPSARFFSLISRCLFQFQNLKRTSQYLEQKRLMARG